MKRIFASAKKGNDLEIMLYDQIGGSFFSDGVTAKDVAAQIKAAGTFSAINLRINSPGGDVFEGASIYNLLVSSGVPVNVMVDGIAASIASVIAMAGTTITMGENAMMMIHNPHAVTVGDARDMRAMAGTLDKVKESMITSYMRKYNGTQEQIAAIMDAETWFTAKDCVDCGIATAIMLPDNAKEAQALAASFDLSTFKNTPEALKKKAQAAQCGCPCLHCVEGDHSACTNAECNSGACTDCPMQSDSKAASLAYRKSYLNKKFQVAV